MIDRSTEDASTDNMVRDNEIDLRRLFLIIWRTRYFVLSTVILSGLLLAGLLALTRAAIPSQQVFHQAISFTFQGLVNGKYPNNTDFSIGDVIAPTVLQEVFKTNKLSQHGVKLNAFMSSVSIFPYSPAYGSAFDRYRARLGGKKLKFAERQEVEKEMQEELSKLRGKSALLQLTLNKRIGISKDVGRKLLHDIVSVWSRKSIEQLGVLKLPEGYESKDLVDMDRLKNMSIDGGLYFLAEAIGQSKSYINTLRKYGGGGTIIDESSGHTLNSLVRMLDNFELYPDGLSPQRILLKQYYIQRIQLLKLEKQAKADMAETLKIGLDSYTEDQRSALGGSPANDAAGAVGQSPVLQFDDAFIDKIISLAQRSVDQEYRTKLLAEYIALKKTSIRIDRNAKKLATVLATLEKHTSGESGGISRLSNLDSEEAKLALRQSAEKLNEFWGISGRLFDQLSIKRVSHDKQLFNNLELPTSQIYQSHHPIFNKMTAIIYFSVLFALAVLSMFSGVLWQILRGGKARKGRG